MCTTMSPLIPKNASSVSRLALILIATLAMFLCELDAQNKYPGLRGKYSMDIESAEVYKKLAGKPLSDKYGQVRSVKVMLELETGRIFYTNSLWYPYHYSFAKYLLHFKGSLYDFNQKNYSSGRNERQYLLATVNHFASTDTYVLEFSVADEIDVEDVLLLYERIKSSFYKGNELRMFLNSDRFSESFSGVEEVNTITADEIYQNQKFQALNKKEAFGYLKRMDIENFDFSAIGEHDILLINGTPNDIPLCAAVITTDFQTPLSHINVLCQNRGTPIMAWKDAWQSEHLKEFNGELVRFKVKQDTFALEMATLEEARKKWSAKEKRKPVRLKSALERKGLFEMKDLKLSSVSFVGGKAANFAELAKVQTKDFPTAPVPEGAFAIPFVYYHEHAVRAGIPELLEKLLSETEPAGKAQLLSIMRNKMTETEIDPDLLKMVEEKICEISPSTRMRFRSSTNAEDIKGFNGAGLYSSKTGIIGDPLKSVEDAIKGVWASVWADRAYQEREYFKIDQSTVAMGVLIHRSFPDEYANGVCITSNLYRKTGSGYLFNVQLGETSIVKPPPGVNCDQFICYSDSPFEFYTEKEIIEYISFSSLNDLEPILHKDEVVKLTKYLSAVEKHFLSIYSDDGKVTEAALADFSLDIEFKFDKPDRQLYVKQVRLFESAQ